MPRPNPGPFEPLLYFIQTPGAFRIIGLGGLLAFSLLFLWQAALHGWIFAAAGVILAAAMWLESSLQVCRRCRHFGSWHCLGQAVIVARLFARIPGRLSAARARLHALIVAIYVLYGLFWLWHVWPIGLIFTLWVPLAFLSAIPPNGFSWRAATGSTPA